jgi:hypothetical protein
MESFYKGLTGHGSCLGFIVSWAILIFLSGCVYTLVIYLVPPFRDYLDSLGTVGKVLKYLFGGFLVLLIFLVGTSRKSR